jgi:hypothetical protein
LQGNILPNLDVAVVDSNAVSIAIPIIVNIKTCFDILFIERKRKILYSVANKTNLINWK